MNLLIRFLLCFSCCYLNHQLIAYPLFFACTEEHQLRFDLSSLEVKDLFTKYLNTVQQKKPEVMLEECLKDAYHEWLLHQKNQKTLAQSFTEKLTETNETVKLNLYRDQFITFKNEFFSAEKNLNAPQQETDISEKIYLCTQKRKSAASNLWLSKSESNSENMGSTWSPYYPFFTPYMYPMAKLYPGEKGSTFKLINRIQQNDLEKVVYAATVTDQDPYALLSIALMENGTDLSQLSLDPIGYVDTLGCSTKPIGYIGPAADSPRIINSYSSYYWLENPVARSSSLNQILKNMTETNGGNVDPGVSYLCYNHQVDSFLISPIPKNNECCNQINFKADETLINNSSFNLILTAYSLKKYLSLERVPKSIISDTGYDLMAYRLQAFNGFSKNFGTTEPLGVGHWRAGVNHYKTPTYGWQASDYILNLLTNNSYINDVIERKKKQIPSLLCQSVGPGLHVVDHRYYVNIHRDAPRKLQPLIPATEVSEKNITKLYALIGEINDASNEAKVRLGQQHNAYKKMEIVTKLLDDSLNQIYNFASDKKTIFFYGDKNEESIQRIKQKLSEVTTEIKNIFSLLDINYNKKPEAQLLIKQLNYDSIPPQKNIFAGVSPKKKEELYNESNRQFEQWYLNCTLIILKLIYPQIQELYQIYQRELYPLRCTVGKANESSFCYDWKNWSELLYLQYLENAP